MSSDGRGGVVQQPGVGVLGQVLEPVARPRTGSRRTARARPGRRARAMLTWSAVVSLTSDSGSAACTAATTAASTVRWLRNSSGPVTSVTCPRTSEARGVAMVAPACHTHRDRHEYAADRPGTAAQRTIPPRTPRSREDTMQPGR